MSKYIEALDKHRDAALQAFALYRAHCNGAVPSRVPGMDTVIRLAWRIECGRTVEDAAAREYLYRWNLAIKAPDQCANRASSIFGTPHAIGL